MAEIEFNFREEDSRVLGKVLRSVARIEVVNGEKKFHNLFYVDSGADFSLIPKSVGDFLEYKITENDKIEEAKGIGGRSIPYVLKNAVLKLGGQEIQVRLGWCLIEDVPLILGRLDVFDKCQILFDNGKKTVFKHWRVHGCVQLCCALLLLVVL